MLHDEALQRIRKLPQVKKHVGQVDEYHSAMQSKLSRLGLDRQEQGSFTASHDVAGVVREGVRTYHAQSGQVGSYYPTPGDELGHITSEQSAELDVLVRCLDLSCACLVADTRACTRANLQWECASTTRPRAR